MKHLIFVAVAGIGVALPAASQSSTTDLNTCAAITTQAERLACYDKLAGRGPQPSPTAAAPQPTPSPAAASASKRAPAPQPASAPASVPNPVPASAATPAPGTPEAFGLYTAEHPAAPKSAVDSVTGKVVDLKFDTYGRETVSLEGGPMWQLAGSDALLAKGDEVTIKRATLGSYILTTPSGRLHRVKRLH